MATYYTAMPAPGYYDYSTSTSTSPSPDEYGRYAPPPSRSTKRHHVRTTSYTPPRVSTWQSAPPFSGSPTYYHAAPRYASPPVAAAKYDYVSSPEPPAALRPKTRRRSASGPAFEVHSIDINGKASRRTSVRLPTQRIYVDASDDAYDADYKPVYLNISPRTTSPQSSSKTQGLTPKKKKSGSSNADHFLPLSQSPVYYDDAPVDTPTRSRARRSSTSTRQRASPPPAEKPASRVPRPATAADATRYSIPAGYVLKNWDPSERPVLLLGSVFDANSLGKWIYDWTVYHHGPGSPMAEVAGELWLLMIRFSSKMRRLDEGARRVRGGEDRELVAEFQESGSRLWRRLDNLLKVCEEFMWRAAKKGSSKGAKPQMGEQSGVEFVRTIFGRDRQLDESEKIMATLRLWVMRYDTNVDPLLRTRKH